MAVISSTIALNVEPHTQPLNVPQDALQPLHHALSHLPPLPTAGFLYGFLLDYVGLQAPSTSNNLRSATQNPAAVNEKLEKELRLGGVAGPFRGFTKSSNVRC